MNTVLLTAPALVSGKVHSSMVYYVSGTIVGANFGMHHSSIAKQEDCYGKPDLS